MTPFRLTAFAFILFLGVIARPLPATPAQKTTEPAKASAEAFQQIQDFLDHQTIEAKLIQTKMPVVKFLEALTRQIPKDMQLVLRIDSAAFGDNLAKVAATPMSLPEFPKKVTLRSVLHLIIEQIAVPTDYRIGPGEIVLTTPQRALHTVVYDIQDLVSKPAFIPLGPKDLDLRTGDQAQKATRVAQAVFSLPDSLGVKPFFFDGETLEILNGTQLAITTNAARHTKFADAVLALRRLSDCGVTLQARLYEVDDAFYSKLKNVKRIAAEELEKQILAGLPNEMDPLWELLQKLPAFQAGLEITERHGATAALLLARQRVVKLLPSPDQILRGEKELHTVVEGITFAGDIHVSPDRRFIRLKLTEKATSLVDIEKSKVRSSADGKAMVLQRPVFVDAQRPVFEETTQSRLLDIPDGGSCLIPVLFRPPALKAKDRWWVLSVTARIRIEEEELLERDSNLQALLPALLADVLKNSRLKTTRDFYGTPDDKRFALVNSDSWSWSTTKAEYDVPGFQLTQAKREGNRLLGIRVDKTHFGENAGEASTITVTLINVGGSANGAVVGVCTLRYTARQTEKGWVVTLAD